MEGKGGEGREGRGREGKDNEFVVSLSVLPRPFLQGATPCPFLVTPCLF